MNALLKKMNFKGEELIHVLRSPENLDDLVKEMGTEARVAKSLKATDKATFILAFCKTQKEVDAIAELSAKTLQGDGLLWFAYPKGTSKKYKADFNRDNGWKRLGELGFEPVRMVALDEDWSALRFRRVAFIKTMARSVALSEEGKQKIKK